MEPPRERTSKCRSKPLKYHMHDALKYKWGRRGRRRHYGNMKQVSSATYKFIRPQFALLPVQQTPEWDVFCCCPPGRMTAWTVSVRRIPTQNTWVLTTEDITIKSFNISPTSYNKNLNIEANMQESARHKELISLPAASSPSSPPPTELSLSLSLCQNWESSTDLNLSV